MGQGFNIWLLWMEYVNSYPSIIEIVKLNFWLDNAEYICFLYSLWRDLFIVSLGKNFNIMEILWKPQFHMILFEITLDADFASW